MSQVLALKAGMKRPFDDMAIDHHETSTACSPHRIQFLQPPSPKRLRTFTTNPPTSSHLHTHITTHPSKPLRVQHNKGDEDLVRHIPKRLRRQVLNTVGRGGSSTERLFTIEDVKEIVGNVVEEKVGEVKKECEEVMQGRLEDQWKVFTRYHEDFVARSYRGRDISYLS